MSMSSAQSLPQSSSIEPRHNHPLTIAADTPEHPQPGTIQVPPILGRQERSATLESLLETLNRASMQENRSLNPTPLPTPRAATNRSQGPPGHRHVRPVIPDPVIPGPNAPMTVLPPSTPGNRRPRRLSIAGRILVFFGYGRNNRARKELVSVISTLVVAFSQVGDRHLPTLCLLMQRVVSFLTMTDRRDHHAPDHLDAQKESHQIYSERVGRVW